MIRCGQVLDFDPLTAGVERAKHLPELTRMVEIPLDAARVEKEEADAAPHRPGQLRNSLFTRRPIEKKLLEHEPLIFPLGAGSRILGAKQPAESAGPRTPAKQPPSIVAEVEARR